MILKEPEYISMQEAANTYDVSIERLCRYAEEEKLPVYLKSPPPKNQFCKLVKPEWTYGRLIYVMAISVDNNDTTDEHLEKMHFLGPTDSMQYSILWIKPSELTALSNGDICNPEGAMNNTENQRFSEKSSNPGLDLKKLQTAEIDDKIQILCIKIKKAVEKHYKGNSKERIINHARFVNEEDFQDGKEKLRALKLVREYIKSNGPGIAFQGYDYARKKMKKGAPYFI